MNQPLFLNNPTGKSTDTFPKNHQKPGICELAEPGYDTFHTDYPKARDFLMNFKNMVANMIKHPHLLINRNFTLLFSGKVISLLWDQIYTFALSCYILDLTHSSAQQSIFLVINCAISAIISPFGGNIADRYSRKRIMVLMDVIRGIVVLIMALLFWQNLIQIWMLYISAIILSFCGAVFSPTASAIIPNIVEEEQLVKATSLDQIIWGLAAMVGLLLGGVLFQWIGIFLIFLLTAASYFTSGTLEACLKITEFVPTRSGNVRYFKEGFRKTMKELQEGFRYVKSNKLIFSLMKMNAMFHLTVFPIIMVFFPYIYRVLLQSTSSFQLSIAQSAGWVGVIIGSLIAPAYLTRYKIKTSIFWGLLIYSLSTFILVPVFLPQIHGYFSNWGITLSFSTIGIIIGLAVAFFDIPITVIYQKYTANEYRGRFWGLNGSLLTMTMAIGYFIGGILAEKVWMGYLFLGITAITTALNLWVNNVKEIREMNE